MLILKKMLMSKNVYAGDGDGDEDGGEDGGDAEDGAQRG